MGVTHVTVRVSNLARDGTPFEDEFLVDTGAIDCMVPGERLVRAGIRPEQKSVYELANGQSVEYEVGFARIAFNGAETVAPMIFGPADTQAILGVVALESAGFTVDPISQTLKKIPAKPPKSPRKNNLYKFERGWHVPKRSEGRGRPAQHALRSSGRATQLIKLFLRGP